MTTENTRAILDRANKAFEEGRLDDFIALCTPDVVMRWPGTTEEWRGTDAIHQNMAPMMAGGGTMKILVTEKIVDGDRAMGHGSMEMTGPDGKPQTMYFSDIYHFTDGKISEVISYMIMPGKNSMGPDPFE